MSPIPGATAKGRLANSPHMRVASADERAVLVVTSLMGRPAPLRIWGFTTRMYAIVRKVEKPARSSTEMLLPRSVMWKYLGMGMRGVGVYKEGP